MAESTDLIFRIFASADGDGFKKTADDAELASDSVEHLGEKSEEVSGKRVVITVSADTGDADEKLAATGAEADAAGKSADNSKSGWEQLHGSMILMGAGVAAVAPALAALPAVMAGLGMAGVTMALGFGGVVKALQDWGAAQQAVGPSSAQLAQTAFSNATAIASAQQAITDAERQSGIQAQNSAQAIASAQQGVVDANRAAADSARQSAQAVVSAQQGVTQALYAQQQAEQSLQNAEYSEQQATVSLTQAKLDAANQVTDLNNAQADSALGVQSATLAVAQAQQNLIQTNNSGTATALQRQQAALQLAQAQQGLVDAQQRATEATQKANTADKQGVDQNPQVLAAQHAAELAAQQVAAAQHAQEQASVTLMNSQTALATAQQQQAEQQLTSLEQIGKAETALATAQRTADQQKVASDEQVANAIKNLTNTEEQQKLAAAAAMSSSSAASAQFAKDMAKLTPAGREFVDQVISMRGGLHELSASAQSTMLPGFTGMLRDSQSLLPTLNTGVRGMGTTISGLAQNFGSLLAAPFFQGQFRTVLQEGNGLVQQLGTGTTGLFAGMVSSGAQAAPIVSALGAGFQTLLGQGIPEFLFGLASGGTGAADSISGLAGIVSDLLGPVGTLVGAVSSALGPVLLALRPVIQQLAGQLLTALLPVLPPLSKALVAVAQVVAQLLPLLVPLIQATAGDWKFALQIVTPMLQTLSTVLQDNQKWLVPLVAIVASVASGIGVLKLITEGVTLATEGWTVAMKLFTTEGLIAEGVTKAWGVAQELFNAVMSANPLMLVVLAVAALTAAAVYCWDHFAGFRQFIQQMWSDIKGWFDEGVKWVQDHFDSFVQFFEGLPQRLEVAGAKMFLWMGSAFKGGVNDVIQGINWLIDQVNGLVHDVSDAWTWAGAPAIPSIPHVPMLATGGTIASAGLAIVGEQGPELVHLPTGASVFSNQQSAGMLGGAGGGAGHFTADLNLKLNGSQIDTVLVTFQRQGGVLQSVQNGALAALGTRSR